ncbi:MAG: 6-bladed beta-propeller, partial [Prevotellaceae bacterium]|nr:6-bladed beta-propeller [Prevotellaceae bacterium]
MKNILLLFASLYLCLSCGKSDNKTTYEKSTYFIDLDSIKRENTFRTSDIFKKINVIILEDHDYAILSDISSLQIFENKIFILDAYKISKLFVFDKSTGKYLMQIGAYGEGPGEYRGITDFCIDTIRKEIYLLDDPAKRVYKYNIETGKYIAYLQLPVGECDYRYIVFSDENLYLNTMHWEYEKNDSRLMEIDFETGKYKEYISGNKYNLGWNRPSYTKWNFFASKNKYPKYVEEYMNTVFAIEPDSVYPYLTIKYKDWMT